MPNPTNEIVAPFYGIGPLWKTEYSQGVVVKAEDDDDYYIVMECSSKNKGYKHTKVILTMVILLGVNSNFKNICGNFKSAIA